MEDKLFTGGEDYEKDFNPKDYLTTYCTMAENEILKFSLEKLFQTFSKGGVGGDILINVGSGPTIYQLLSACEVFREIITTDYTSKNLQELQKWLKNEPGAYDWSPATQYVCTLEGDRSKWQEKEAKLRRTVTHMLKCDVSKISPLGSVQVPPADCILTCLALECACPDVDAYCAALHNLSSLLKPGGYLVTIVILHFQYYMVGSKTFSGLYLEKETVEKALQDAGFQVLQCEHQDSLSYTPTNCVNDGICFVVARKGPGA